MKYEMVRQEAEERVARSKRYAEMFPHLMRAGEERFQNIEWQEDYLRRIYKLEPLERVNTPEEVNRKEYMREYMRKRREAKRGGKV